MVTYQYTYLNSEIHYKLISQVENKGNDNSIPRTSENQEPYYKSANHNPISPNLIVMLHIREKSIENTSLNVEIRMRSTAAKFVRWDSCNER